MSRLVGLYPRAWRARYGQELDDLIASRRLGLSGAADLIRGAVDAHRHPELVDPTVAPPTGTAPVSRQRFEDLRVARRLGWLSWFGAIVWTVGWIIAANGPVVVDALGSYRDSSGGAPMFFGAIVLLSAGLVGQLIRLPGRARVARLAAVLTVVTGPLWALAPWILWMGLALIIGLVVLSVAAWWSSEWSGSSALIVGAPAVLGAVAMVLELLSGARGPIDRADPMIIGVTLLTLIWVGVGATLQQLPDVVEPDVPTGGPAREPASA